MLGSFFVYNVVDTLMMTFLQLILYGKRQLDCQTVLVTHVFPQLYAKVLQFLKKIQKTITTCHSLFFLGLHDDSACI